MFKRVATIVVNRYSILAHGRLVCAPADPATDSYGRGGGDSTVVDSIQMRERITAQHSPPATATLDLPGLPRTRFVRPSKTARTCLSIRTHHLPDQKGLYFLLR